MAETVLDKIRRMKRWCSVCGKRIRGKYCPCQVNERKESE